MAAMCTYAQSLSGSAAAVRILLDGLLSVLGVLSAKVAGQPQAHRRGGGAVGLVGGKPSSARVGSSMWFAE